MKTEIRTFLMGFLFGFCGALIGEQIGHPILCAGIAIVSNCAGWAEGKYWQ